MNYSALPHEFGEYCAYFDVEYTASNDEINVLDFSLVSVYKDDTVEDLKKNPQLRIDAMASFSTNLENGCYNSVLTKAANSWRQYDY
jgi:hypothetical protein